MALSWMPDKGGLLVTAALTVVSSTETVAQTVAPPESSREVGTVAADTKLAFIDIVRVAAESRVGKALSDRVAALNQQKVNELNEKQKVLQAAQQKLESAATVLNTSAMAQLQRDIERQQIDIRRFTEDAEAEIERLQGELENQFEAKLSPIVEKVAVKHGLHLLRDAVRLYEAAFREQVASPLRLSVAEEVQWYFQARQSLPPDADQRFGEAAYV